MAIQRGKLFRNRSFSMCLRGAFITALAAVLLLLPAVNILAEQTGAGSAAAGQTAASQTAAAGQTTIGQPAAGQTTADQSASTAAQPTVKKHLTVYKGQDYSRVYDYDYYTTKVCPKLKGKSDLKVLRHFVTRGIPKRKQGNAAFNVRWYYNQHPELRWKYGQKWKNYYLHYQKKGYTGGAVARCTKLHNPISWYKKNGKKVDLKKIYDFEYFTKHNASAYKYRKNKDDAGAVRYFVNTGMRTGMRGNASASPVSKKYRKLVKKFHRDYMSTEFYKAQEYDSSSGWLILLNQRKHLVSVFSGSKGSWTLRHQCCCSIGKASTPTVQGTFYTHERGLYFVTGGCRCWYYTRFYNGYMFHSVLYWDGPSPSSIADGTIGGNVSHGCVRLNLSDARWIYANVPLGAKVVSYNSPF